MGLGLLPGRVEQARSRELKVPHVGWNQVESTLRRRSPSAARTSPFSLPRPLFSRRRPTSRRRAGATRLRLAFRLAVGEKGPTLRRAVPPREDPPWRPAAAARISSALRGAPRRVIVFPAVDMRDGHAVRLTQGEADREHRLQPRSARARGSAGWRPGRSPARGRPRWRAGRERRTSTHVLSPSRGGRRPGPVRRRAGTTKDVEAALEAGAPCAVVGTSPSATRGARRGGTPSPGSGLSSSAERATAYRRTRVDRSRRR